MDDDSAIVVYVLVDYRPVAWSGWDGTNWEMNARTFQCHRQHLQPPQKPGSSRGPPMNATPYRLVDNDIITCSRPNDGRSDLPKNDLDTRTH